jgi:DNA-binding CsgD family transcriptional regulator
VPLQWPLVGRHEEVDLFGATLDDPRAHGFVIHGHAGVGKTRLADQCLAVADARGRNVARATATEGLAPIPLGALAHLLPAGIGDERSDLVKVMSEVRPVLLEQGQHGPLVLFVDDMHHLDATSAALIGQLLDADLLFLVGTVRAGEALPAGLDAAWQRGRVRRIDLADLHRNGVDTLLHLVLGRPVERTTINDFWEASRGNPLYVRELVLGALDGGHLIVQHGVWRLGGPLVTTPRLREVVAARLRSLSPSMVDVLDHVSVWEPVGLAMLEAAVGHDQLEALDRAGLLTVRVDGRRQVVTLSHPQYPEILRDRMPVLTRRRLLLELADRIEAHGARRREDPIRVALARLDATGSGDPALLVRAARVARADHDFARVERLAAAAHAVRATTESGVLLGEAFHELGRFEEAERLLTPVEAAAADDDPLLAHVVEIRARNLMWGLGRDDDGLAVNAVGQRRVTTARAAEELALDEALLRSYAGHPVAALAVLDGLAPPSDVRATVLRAIAEVPALIATGRAVTAVEQARRDHAVAGEVEEQLTLPDPDVLVLHQIYGLAEAGDIAAAAELTQFAYDATPPSAPPDGLMWLSFQLGRCALLSGRPETARRWLGEAVARCDELANVGPSRLVLSALVMAHVLVGATEDARAAAALLAARPPFRFTRPEQELGAGWLAVADGDLPTARRRLLETAELAASAGYLGSEAWALHDVARLGGASAVHERLTALAARAEGELVPAYAAHAAAAAAGDPVALVDAADRFERLGMVLLAAEAANEAAQAFQRRGERRESTAQEGRAVALAATCEGAVTPGVAAPVAVSPLTPRERDIATLAARGDSSRAIAERLVVSVRTVDNHLQNVYTKLGISGRRALPTALARAGLIPADLPPAPPPASPH